MAGEWKHAYAFGCAVILIASALHAEEKCPVEVKFLLSPSTTQTVIPSLGFGKETAGRVYFFDTDALDLLTKGVIVRLRQGANNDLTVKVRLPKDNNQADTSRLHGRFPCEIDQTGVGEDISYSVRCKHKSLQLPETGNDISSLLSPSQRKLLQEAQISIDWAQVRRIANIKSTTWETAAQSSSRKLALELWEWPAGSILELSAKAASDAGQSKYAELQRLVNNKNLSLSASQGTKTSMVLETLTHHTSPLR
jgi:hypothetical protein